jgi:hypothetical protein
MALATKDRYVAKAVKHARQQIAELPAPMRASASNQFEFAVENWELLYKKPLAEEEDLELALVRVIPEHLDEICGGDIPTSDELVTRRFQTLAEELRALKETVERQGRVIDSLNSLLARRSREANR